MAANSISTSPENAVRPTCSRWVRIASRGKTPLLSTPDEIAEAFAATKGVTIPSQSRSSLAVLKRSEGVDVVQRFRELSPYREPISVQRWSVRRILLALGAVLIFLMLLSLLIDNITGAGFI